MIVVWVGFILFLGFIYLSMFLSAVVLSWIVCKLWSKDGRKQGLIALRQEHWEAA